MDARSVLRNHYTVAAAKAALGAVGVVIPVRARKEDLLNLLLNNTQAIPADVRARAVPPIGDNAPQGGQGQQQQQQQQQQQRQEPPVGNPTLDALVTAVNALKDSVLTIQDDMAELQAGRRTDEGRGIMGGAETGEGSGLGGLMENLQGVNAAPGNFAPPPRGKTLSALPTIEERFAFVRPSSLVDDATSGKFPMEKLYVLLDPNSLLGAPSVRERKGDGQAEEEQIEDVVSRFVKAFPTTDIFITAWNLLCDLYVYTLDDPVTISDTVAAFHWHGNFMIEYSRSFGWDGLLRYHFGVASDRSKHGFVPSQWYRQKDTFRFDAVVRPKTSATAFPATPAPAAARQTVRPPPYMAPGAGPVGQICHNFSSGRCGNPCQYNRLHVCARCPGNPAHNRYSCPIWKAETGGGGMQGGGLTGANAVRPGAGFGGRGAMMPNILPPSRPNTFRHYPIFSTSDAPAAKSPLVVSAWKSNLRGYLDESFVNDLVGAMVYGLRLGYEGPFRDRGRGEYRNLPMTREGEAHVEREVEERVRVGELVEWRGEGEVVVSPVGAVPKDGSGWRTIHHLSAPRAAGRPSVNDGIDRDWVSLEYASLEGLFEGVRRCRRRRRPCVVWKGDLASAFRHCVVGKEDSRLLGMKVGGRVVVDTRLPFGCRSSPYLFNLFAEALHWILERRGLELTHYLDDFFGVVEDGDGVAELAVFREVVVELGLSVQDKKLVSGRCVEVLGIMVDCERGRALISEERRARVLGLIDGLLGRGTATGMELMVVAGHLVFVCRICPVGRAFLRRVYEEASGRLHHPERRRVGHGAKLDLRWWRDVLKDWDGVLLLDDKEEVEVWTDASGTIGMGGHLGPREAPADMWAAELGGGLKGKDIMVLEGLALLESLRRWRGIVRGKRVVCAVDNTVLFEGLRSGSCRYRPLQAVLRTIFHFQLSLPCEIAPRWIPSRENYLADALSRLDLTSDLIPLAFRPVAIASHLSVEPGSHFSMEHDHDTPPASPTFPT